MSNNLFPSLGDIAQRTNAMKDVDDNDARLAEDAPGQYEQQEGEEKEMQEIESMCMRCHDNGTTRMLLTTIPYFKEIVVSSFRCDKCGHRDTEIQSAGEIQPKGIAFTVHLRNRADLDRQIVKSNFASVLIPSVELTIPPGRGQLTTVEGLIRDTVRDLNISQPVRRVMDPPTGARIDAMLTTLREYIGLEEGEEEDDGGVGNDDEDAQKPRRTAEQREADLAQKPFTPFSLTVEDPSGNSFVQFLGGTNDAQWNMRPFNRTFDQNVTLGLVARPDDAPETTANPAVPQAPLAGVDATHKLASMAEFEMRKRDGNVVKREDGTIVPDEVFSFPSTCSSCGHELETLMQQVNIPYFQDIIIMATNCYACGYRDNEVKSGGAISDTGKRITLKVEDEEDLSRDMLKSDTAGLEIPEIDLVLQPGTLGGRFTTLEGLLNEIYSELSTKVFRTGDSLTSGMGQIENDDGQKEERNFEDFLKGLKECMGAERPFTLILDDPVSNSYLQNLYAPDADPNMVIEEYKRTHEQNEELGLNDVVLEGYDPDAEGTLGQEGEGKKE